MLVTTYGTRGSIPVSRPGTVKFGGNTTCLRVESDRLPEGTWLVVDTGSGFVPLAYDALKAGVKKVIILQTHHHHDHNQGLLLAPLTFIKQIPIHIYGPVQNGVGPKEVLEQVMRKPLFPVDFKVVASHFHINKFDYPSNLVFLVHPVGGFKRMDVDAFERAINKDGKLPFGPKTSFDVEECLVIRMHSTEHPEQTISYRFEERTSGKTFCLLTDHENQDGIPLSLRAHLADADLLIEDVQYDEATYQARTAGFGHGTAKYAVRLANLVGAKRLGLTHHDPMSDDDKVEAILREAKDQAQQSSGEESGLDPDNIFACADYDEYDV